MDKKVYDWKGIKTLIREQDYKHVALCDNNGKKLCSYNPLKAKDGLSKKLAEIEKRMKVLEPGVYIVNCQTKYGNGSPVTPHYLGIGSYNPDDVNTTPPVHIHMNERAPAQRTQQNENPLSYETALNHVQEIAELRSENARLKSENERLKKDVEDLEAELDEGGGMGEDNPFTPVIEGLLPVADRFLDLQERKQRSGDIKMMLKEGYDLDEILGHQRGSRRSSRNGSRRNRPAQRNGVKPLPRPGGRGWDEFVDAMAELDDDDFSDACEEIKTRDKNVYEALQEEFEFEEVDDNEEQEEEEEEEQQEQN